MAKTEEKSLAIHLVNKVDIFAAAIEDISDQVAFDGVTSG
jgi:hypothetical protein